MPTYNVMFAVNVRFFSGLFDGSIEITIIIWCAWNRTDQSISIKIGHWVTVRKFHFIWHTKSLRTFTWQCTNMYHADNLAFFRTEYLCKTLHFCFFITLYSFARAKFCFYLTSSKKNQIHLLHENCQFITVRSNVRVHRACSVNIFVGGKVHLDKLFSIFLCFIPSKIRDKKELQLRDVCETHAHSCAKPNVYTHRIVYYNV